MEIVCWSSSYCQGGGSTVFSPIGHLLTAKLSDYGSAINTIFITASLFDPAEPPRPQLLYSHEQFKQRLEKLPYIRFQRNLKKVEICFLSQRFVPDDDESNRPSLEKTNRAFDEICDTLQLFKKRIKPTDDFRINDFLADVNSILAKRFESLDEMSAIKQMADEKCRALRAAKDPWERLEIDWTEFHPQAREILDDPFYWELADDYSPNGNDTGADLLTFFQGWEKKNRTKSPMIFFKKLLTRWGVEPIDWHIVEPDAVGAFAKDNSIPLQICDESAIGLAFAVIKLRGICPDELAQMALGSLKRTAILTDYSDLPDEIKAGWRDAIGKMRDKLEPFAKGNCESK
jgi:uncharacterized protein YfeS